MGRYGLVYIAHNPRDGKNTFKVGKTQRDIAGRMAELTASTSNIGSYSPLAYFIVADIDAAEQACHSRLAQYRIQKNREFFEVELSLLIQIVKKQISPYLAQNLIPENLEVPTEESEESVPLSERIKNKRNRAREIAEVKEKEIATGKEVATKLFYEWAKDLTEKLKIIGREFADVPFILWATTNSDVPKTNDFCVVSILLLANIEGRPAHRVAEIRLFVHLNQQLWQTHILLHVEACFCNSQKIGWEKYLVGSKRFYSTEEAMDLLAAILAEYAGNPIRNANVMFKCPILDST
jgi:hypothetical protein